MVTTLKDGGYKILDFSSILIQTETKQTNREQHVGIACCRCQSIL